MSGYNFTKLSNAKAFANRCNKPHYIFELPEGGYIVVDARTAKKLMADGHQDVK